MGDTYRMTGNFLGAKDAYTAAISLSKQMRKKIMRADAMVGLGLSLRALGAWKAALKLFTQARSIYEEKSDTEGMAFALWAEGGAFRVGGDAKNAIHSFRKAQRLFSSSPEVENQEAKGYCLCGLGGVSRVAGLWGDSLNYYTEANKFLLSLHDRFGVAYSHCGIGNALRMKGAYTEAMKHLKKAETLYKKIGDIVSYSYTLWSMAMTYLMKGRLKEAEQCLEKAARRFRKTRDVRGLIYCRLGLGEVLFLRGDISGAKKALTRSLNDSRKHDFILEASHSEALLDYITKERTDNSCYKKIGLRLKFSPIPFNIP
jgi:tetratricopeptide (TPR) repeat protein